MIRTVLSALLLASVLPALAQDWQPLFNGRNLDGWQVRGDAIWTVVPGGVLLGQRRIENPADPFSKAWPVSDRQYRSWLYQQAWIYTEKEYGEFDLHVEYFLPVHGNSGISIRDVSRAHFAINEALAKNDPPLKTELKGTPAHIGYEIQIIDNDAEKYPTGSIYTFVASPKGLQKMGDWNTMEIESRKDKIRVTVNGNLAAEFPGESGRPLVGPIGLQLHDQFTFMMFRNLRIRER